MSQIVSYVFQFQGLDEGINKTEKLKSNIAAINASSGRMGNFGGSTNAANISTAGSSNISSGISSAATLALNSQVVSLSKQIGTLISVLRKPAPSSIPVSYGSSQAQNIPITQRIPHSYAVNYGNRGLGGESFQGTVSNLRNAIALAKQQGNKEILAKHGIFGMAPNIPLQTEDLSTPQRVAQKLSKLPSLAYAQEYKTFFHKFQPMSSSIKKSMVMTQQWADLLKAGKPMKTAAESPEAMFPPHPFSGMSKKKMKAMGSELLGGQGVTVNPEIKMTQDEILKKQQKGTGGMGGQMSMNPFFNPQFWTPLMNDVKRLFGGIGKIFGGVAHGGTAGMRHILRAAGLDRHMVTLATHLGKLGLVVAGVVIVLLAFRESLKLLVEGIKEGSEAYKQAAAQGLNVATSTQINKAFSSIGMSTPNMQGSAVAYALGQGNDTQAILNAARAGQFGEQGQQLLNMSEEFREAMSEAAGSSRQMEKASEATFQMNFQAAQAIREWKTLLAQSAGNFQDVAQPILESVKYLLQAANDLAELAHDMRHPINALFGKAKENQQYPFGKGMSVPGTSLEHLGLVMRGAAGPDKHLQDISHNTGRMVQMFNTFIGLFNTWIHYGPNMGIPGQSYIHLPQLPQ